MLAFILALAMALSVAEGTINITTGAVGTTFTVSGLPFEPKAILFFWSGRAANGMAEEDHKFGSGIAVGTTAAVGARRAYTTQSDHSPTTTVTGYLRRNDACIATLTAANAIDGLADLDAILSDGFRLIIDDQFSAALQVGWKAWGGTDLTDVEIVDIQAPAATGTQDIATAFALNTGLDDKAVIFIGQSGRTDNVADVNSRFFMGAAACDTPANAVMAGASRTARGTSSTFGYGRNGDCIAMLGLLDALDCRASVSAWLSTGFRLSWTVTTAGTFHCSALVLKGGRYSVGDALTSTGTTNQVKTTAYQPKSLLVASHCRAASAAGTVDVNGDERSIGVATSATSRRAAYMHDKDAAANADVGVGYAEDRMYGNIDTGATMADEGAMDLVSFNATPSFTYVMDDADPAAAFFWFLLSADTPAGGATNIDPGFIASTAQVFDPALIEADIIVQSATIATTAQVFEPTLIDADIILPGFIASTATVPAPTIESPVAIDPAFIATTAQVFEPGVGQGIGTQFIASTATVPDPAVVTAIILLPGHIASTAQVFEPNLGGADVIDVGALTPLSAVFEPSIANGQTITQSARIESSAQVFEPTLITFEEISIVALRGFRAIPPSASLRHIRLELAMRQLEPPSGLRELT